MKIVSEIIVSQPAQVVFNYLSDPRNSPKWDRSVAEVILPNPDSVKVGDKITTIAPSGMRQTFTIKKLVAHRLVAFALDTSAFFKNAELQFLIDPVASGTRITHVITIEFKGMYLFLYPVIRLTYKKALATDLNLLAAGLDSFAGKTP